jgi:hypothetical protein
MLPAIVFHFNRQNCVYFAEALAKRFAAEETDSREKDGTQEKIRALQAQIELEKKWYEKHARDAEVKLDTKNLPENIHSINGEERNAREGERRGGKKKKR